MSNKLLPAATVIILALSGSALAQTTTPASATADRSPTSSPASPDTASSATASNLSVGMAVNDKTGAAIGQITDVKPDASGRQVATVKMGAQSFAVATANLSVQNGVAVVNASRADIENLLANKPHS